MNIAHKRDGEVQSVADHLTHVAERAGEFADRFQCGEYAYMMGLAHDIGKYSVQFQRKIQYGENISVDHSTAGARELFNRKMCMGAFAVAGHHGGLPDGISGEEGCLFRRIKERKLEDYGAYSREITLTGRDEPRMKGFEGAFLTRMLFSCLVDADFLDTEDFMQNGTVKRAGYEELPVLQEKLKKYISGWLNYQADEKSINFKRTEILKSCIQMGQEKQGLYSLTVPTGAGKTISSLAFALEHAVKNHMDRIIYVIPYTSIIEQNAKVFRDIVGEKNVVEHHANALLEKDGEKDNYLKLHQLSTENWDAPIIVTTNVQFFESLYSNKVSNCRKLHNIANSVIIFDEAQMIPLNYLKPCIRAVRELIEGYHVTAVMCTATQPALGRWFETLEMKEISPEQKEMFLAFKRSTIKTLGKVSKEELCSQIIQQNQMLVIVNRKKTAQELFEKIKGEGTFHLSTNMTPSHRMDTLNRIRECLNKGLKCRVISTSLVEAGVDLDFPSVFREEAGLDSIIQAAGRCNREGKRAADQSNVWIFSLEEEPVSMIEKNIGMTKETIAKYKDYASLEAIKYYFEQLQNLDEEYLDQKKVIEAFEKGKDGIKIPFKAVAETFHLIESNTRMLIIPREFEAAELLKELEYRKKERENFKTVLRRLGMYSVNVFENRFKRLTDNAAAYEILPNIYVLQRLELYDSNMGLSETDAEDALFI